MSGGRVVHSGWLKKSPPEKKLRLCAWRTRWFVLRSGHQSGDPGVLEYYKKDHSKKPLRIICLTLCEQVHLGVTFHKKGLPDGFVFDVKTKERTFYLVAGTKEDMNKWVQIICQVCGFQPQENTDSLGSVFSATPEPHHTEAENNSSDQQRNTNPSSCSQPSLLTCDPSVSKELPPICFTRNPGEHIHLHLHMHPEGAQSTRSNNFTESPGSSFLMRNDLAIQKGSEGNRHRVLGACGEAPGLRIPKSDSPEFTDCRDRQQRCCACGKAPGLCIPELDSPEFRDRRGRQHRCRASGEAPGLCIPESHSPEFKDCRGSQPMCWASQSCTRVSPTSPSSDSEGEDTFKTPRIALYQEIWDPPGDRVDLLSAALAACHIPKIPTPEKNVSTVAMAIPGSKATTAPLQPHKASQTESQLGCHSQTHVVSEKLGSVSATGATVVRKKKSVSFASSTVFIEKQSSLSFSGAIPKRRALHAVDNTHLQEASLQESEQHFQGHTESAGSSSEYKNIGAFFPQPSKAVVGPLDKASPEDDGVPGRPGPCILLDKKRAVGNSQDSHASRSPRSLGCGPLSSSPTDLPAHQDPTRESEVQPPPIDRSLKPSQKAKPAALDLRGSSIFIQSPSQPPRAISCTSQDVHPGDSEGMPVLAVTQPLSLQPSRYFPAFEEVDSIEVLAEKTQGQEHTRQEWIVMQQFTAFTKGAKT